MTKEQIGIWFIVGVMAFSVVGIGLAVVLEDNPRNAAENIIADSLEPDPIFPEDAFIVEEDVTELEIIDIVEGDGEEVAPDDTVTIHYRGTLADTGQQFDSSFDRGEPATFPLANLIEGWQEGIPGLKVGGTRRLVIPSEQGYGAVGQPPIIPANADLVFEIELIGIEEPFEDAIDLDSDDESDEDSVEQGDDAQESTQDSEDAN